MKKFLALVLSLIMVLSLVACGGTSDDTATDDTATDDTTESAGIQVNAEDLKVAILLPGTINDMGWSTTAYNGLLAIGEQYGCETNYMETVPVSGYEEGFRNYANSGYNVIFGHGSEFYDAAELVAAEFPEVAFIVTSIDKSNGTNCASVNTLPHQMGVLAGVAAAYASKSGVVGTVGGVQYVSINDALNGFCAGAKYVNPDIELLVNVTGDDFDTAKCKEVTLAMIDQGADVIFYDADAAGLGALEACQERGVLAIPAIADQNDLGPDVCLMSSCNALGAAMAYVVGKVVDGTFEGNFYPMGCESGAVFYVVNEPVWNEHMSEEGAAAVQAMFDDFVANPGAEYVDAFIDEYCPADVYLA